MNETLRKWGNFWNNWINQTRYGFGCMRWFIGNPFCTPFEHPYVRNWLDALTQTIILEIGFFRSYRIIVPSIFPQFKRCEIKLVIWIDLFIVVRQTDSVLFCLLFKVSALAEWLVCRFLFYLCIFRNGIFCLFSYFRSVASWSLVVRLLQW